MKTIYTALTVIPEFTEIGSIYYPKICLNMWVLSLFLKMFTLSEFLMEIGRAFHSFGAIDEKLLLPYLTVLVFGTTN